MTKSSLSLAQPTSSRKDKAPWWVKITISLFLILIFYILNLNLGRDYLFDWDEGIYAELGRQLVLRGELFTNYYNGLPWFEKPPGVSWITALGISLAGDSAYGARLLFPLFAVYTLWSTYQIGVKVKSWQTGVIAAGLLATFNLFLGRTRAVNSDMPLLACINTVVLLLLYHKSSFLVALGVFAGVWFKGLAGLLTLIISLPLWFHQSKKFYILVSIFLLLFIMPWHLYSWLKYGSEFLTPYFYEQVLTRATAQIEFHFEPAWYYFHYLYENLGLGVIIIAMLGVLYLVKQVLQTRSLFSVQTLLLWWLFFPLALFTLAKTRLFWYILPIYPALSLVIAYFLTSIPSSKLGRQILTILAVATLFQGILTAYRSVEPVRVNAQIPDRLQVAYTLRGQAPLLVLVPESERLAEALLPAAARLSSSFRYGGMPSFIFYYQGPVEFFYNVDTFNARALTHPYALMVARDDLPRLKFPLTIIAETPDYLGIKVKGIDAHR